MASAPPPKFVAKFLDRRNKIHELGEQDHTQENLMKLFDKKLLDGSSKKKGSNWTTMPARNYCIITEHRDTLSTNSPGSEAEDWPWGFDMKGGLNLPAGTSFKHALDVSIQVEINSKTKTGETRAYRFPIPALDNLPREVAQQPTVVI